MSITDDVTIPLTLKSRLPNCNGMLSALNARLTV